MPNFDNTKTVKEVLHDCKESLKETAEAKGGEIKNLDDHHLASLKLPDEKSIHVSCSSYGTPLSHKNGVDLMHGVPEDEEQAEMLFGAGATIIPKIHNLPSSVEQPKEILITPDQRKLRLFGKLTSNTTLFSAGAETKLNLEEGQGITFGDKIKLEYLREGSQEFIKAFEESVKLDSQGQTEEYLKIKIN